MVIWLMQGDWSAMQVLDGFNVYGYLTSNVGLGVAARNTIQMLLANDVPVAPIDINPGGGGRDPTYAELIAENNGAAPYDVNLFHLNPDRLRYMISPFDRSLDLENRLNVCVPFWEAPRLPRAWLKTLAAMDVILAPSLFVRDAVLADLPDATVIHYPQTVFLPEGVRADRERWGLPADKVVFVASFALASDIERKNPWATLDAFRAGFPQATSAAVSGFEGQQPGGMVTATRRSTACASDAPSEPSVTLIENR